VNVLGDIQPLGLADIEPLGDTVPRAGMNCQPVIFGSYWYFANMVSDVSTLGRHVRAGAIAAR
jgi:hypothetical protein